VGCPLDSNPIIDVYECGIVVELGEVVELGSEVGISQSGIMVVELGNDVGISQSGGTWWLYCWII